MNRKMSRLFKAAAAVCCAGAVMLGACGCTADLTEDAAPVAKEDFRVTSYLVGDTFVDSAAVDYSHFEQITDFIFIGMANFDTSGKITLAQDFETAYDNIKSHLPQGASFYVNIMGPDFTTDSQDWNEQMADKGALHNQAFESGNLEGKSKSLQDFLFDFSAVGVRCAKVEVGYNTFDIVKETDQKRIIQSQSLMQSFNLLRGGVFTEDNDCGVPGSKGHDYKDEESDAQDDRDKKDNSA